MNGAPSTLVSPGLLGFAAFFFLAVALWLLMRNMNARMRRMSYAARRRQEELEQRVRGAETAEAAEDGDVEDAGAGKSKDEDADVEDAGHIDEPVDDRSDAAAADDAGEGPTGDWSDDWSDDASDDGSTGDGSADRGGPAVSAPRGDGQR